MFIKLTISCILAISFGVAVVCVADASGTDLLLAIGANSKTARELGGVFPFAPIWLASIAALLRFAASDPETRIGRYCN